MSKSEFLETISSMSREEINEFFLKSAPRTKKIYPLVIVGKSSNERGNKNEQRTRTYK